MRRPTLLLSLAVLLLAGALAGALAGPAAAQPRPDGPAPRLERLAEHLDLSDAQVEALRARFDALADAARAWREANPDASREARRAFAEEQRAAFRSAFADVLTPAQLAALDQLRPDGRRHRGPGGHGLHALVRGLDLSPDQQAAVRALLERQAEAVRRWRAAHPDATHEERVAFWTAQRTEARAAIEAVLTPEQRERLAERLDRRDDRWGGRHHLADALDLTDAQRADVRALAERQQAAREAWRAEHPDATREERAAFLREQALAFEAAFTALLTPDQAARYRALRAEWDARRAERRERHADRRDHREERREERRERGEDRGMSGGTAERAFGLANHPNPFNPSTEIRFELPEAASVRLAVYDLQGREVARLLDGRLGAGPHAATFTADGLPTGPYLYRLEVGSATETGRMLLVK